MTKELLNEGKPTGLTAISVPVDAKDFEILVVSQLTETLPIYQTL
jgi:hypothetical protein